MDKEEARKFCLDWLFESKDRRSPSQQGWPSSYIDDVVSMLVEVTNE